MPYLVPACPAPNQAAAKCDPVTGFTVTPNVDVADRAEITCRNFSSLGLQEAVNACNANTDCAGFSTFVDDDDGGDDDGNDDEDNGGPGYCLLSDVSKDVLEPSDDPVCVYAKEA